MGQGRGLDQRCQPLYIVLVGKKLKGIYWIGQLDYFETSFNKMSRVKARYCVRHGKIFIMYRKFKDRQELMLSHSRRVAFKSN